MFYFSLVHNFLFLMDRYGLTDPALGPGQFTNPTLQALYDQLIAQGSVSLAEALNVGVLIKQTDIADLQARLAQTDNADIQLVSIHGVVNSYDGMGIGITTDDGQVIYEDTGNPRYSQSVGFAPQIGADVTVLMFKGDQGVNSAVAVTMDATGMTYTFRSETGQPLWFGGNGKGYGGNY